MRGCYSLFLLLLLWDLCFCQADRLREMWLCPPSLSPFSLCCITTDPSALPPHLLPSLPLLSLPPLLPPSFPSPSLPSWASELDCLPFGFPLFLPSSVPPLIAPLFLTSQGCQLSGHSWKIHSRHGNCKQTERVREGRLSIKPTGHRQKAEWRNSQLKFLSFLLYCLPPLFSSLSCISIIFITSAPPLPNLSSSSASLIFCPS